MRLVVTKNLLTKAFDYLCSSNYAADNEDADNSIRISCDNYTLFLEAGNNENHIALSFDAEEVEEVGEIIIDGKDIDKQVKALPGKEVVISGNDSCLYIETTGSEINYNVKMNAVESDKFKDYTAIKTLKLGTIKSKDIALALNACNLAINKKSVKQELRNLGVIAIKGKLTFVGFSGEKLVSYSFPVSDSMADKEYRFTLPVNATKNIAKMFKTGKKDMSITMEKNQVGTFIHLNDGLCDIYVRVIDGNYPAYESVLKHAFCNCISLDADSLKQVIKSLSGINKVDTLLDVTVNAGNLKFIVTTETSTAELGMPYASTADVVPFKMFGKKLKEASDTITGKTCYLEFVDNKMLVVSDESKNIFYACSLIV